MHSVEEITRLRTWHCPEQRRAGYVRQRAKPNIHLNGGHYTFRGNGQIIDMDAIVAGLELG